MGKNKKALRMLLTQRAEWTKQSVFTELRVEREQGGHGTDKKLNTVIEQSTIGEWAVLQKQRVVGWRL